MDTLEGLDDPVQISYWRGAISGIRYSFIHTRTDIIFPVDVIAAQLSVLLHVHININHLVCVCLRVFVDKHCPA